MSLDTLRFALGGYLFAGDDRRGRILGTVLAVAVAAYICWKIAESPSQAVQFAFNGLSVGAVYALLAMGFTLVYSTVWFFDLYYGAAAALGAYGVFYLRSQEALGGLYEVNNPYVNIVFALVTAGVVAWALHVSFFRRLSARFNPREVRVVGGLLAAGAGVYMGLVLSYPKELNVLLSPAVGVVVAAVVGWVVYRGGRGVFSDTGSLPFLVVGAILGVALGAYCGFLVAGAPGSKLYLSWAVSCLLAGIVGLAFYRGLYVYMRERARSPLIMLVASLGILLAMTAATVIVFESAPRPLPDAFGSEPWTILGGNIKGFNIFTIGVSIVGFVALAPSERTSFGKAVRAIGDDEEVSKVVGINTTIVIAGCSS